MKNVIVFKNKWVLILVSILCLSGMEGMAQTTYTWIGGNGSWATSTNWSPTRTTPAVTDILQFNDGGTYTITNVPTTAQTIRQLVVTANTDITLTSTGTATLNINFPVAASNALVIASGSKLTMGSTTITNLSIITTTTQRGDISGELVMANGTFTTSAITTAPGVTVTGAITNSNGAITSSANSLNFASGSFYNHARNGGAVPTATWNAAATINVTGIVNTNVTFPATGTFGNLYWDNTGQTATGAFTGTGTTTIAGNLTVNAGTLAIGAFTTAFNVTGVTTIESNGTLSITSTTGTKNFNNDFINNGTFTNTSEAVTITGNLQNNGTFTAGTGLYSFTGASKTISGSSALSIPSLAVTNGINNHSSLTVGTALTGTTLVMGANSNLYIGGTSTITNLTTTTNTPNTVIYNGTGAQTVKATTYYDIEINKPSNTATAGGTFTVNNNFTVTSGTFATGANITINNNLAVDGGTFAVTGTGVSIIGNTTGAFTMASGGTFSTVRTTAPFFPTNYTTVSLDNNSTFLYANTTTTALTLPLLSTLPISAYPILGIQGGTVARLLAEPTPVYGLNIIAGTLSDNGFQITANAAGTITMASGAGLTLGTAATATEFPLNAVAANISLNTGSTVTYNSNQATTISGEPTYGNLTLAATAATVKTLAADATVMGTMTIGVNNTLDVDGHTLSLGGTLTNSGTTAILMANASTSKIRLIGSSSQTINMGSNLTGGLVSTLEVDKTGGTATLSSTSFDVNDLDIIAGTLSNGSITIGIRNNYSNTGTFTVNSGGAVAFNGTSAQTFDIGTYTSSLLANLIINNPAGVTLTAPLNVSVLTLTDGILTTDASNMLQVNTATAAGVVGGSSTSYVNGPMRRVLPTSSASTIEFLFPVGKGDYNPFVLASPTTTTSLVTVQVEVFDAVAGGTDVTGFSSAPSPARYWQASVTNNPSNLTAIGSIRLQDTDMTIDGSSAIGRSATLTGTYSGYGGANPNSPSTGDLSTTIAVPTALGFFKIGEKGDLCGTYTVGTGEDFATLTEAVNVLNGSNITCDVILELTTNYTGSGETFPIVFNNLSYAGGPWDVTIRPSSSVSSTITIAGDPGSTLALFDFEGIDYLTIDGVPGGSTGSNVIADGKILLRNTRTAATVGPTILFDNDATNNTLKYLQIEGQNVATNSGTIAFGATASATGSSNNTISYCYLPGRTDVSATHRIAIYSLGSTTAGLGNDNNTVENSNIADFWAVSSTVAGIYLGNGNSAWTISGNSFYQTASRTQTSTSSHYGIFMSNTTGTDFTVSGNYIGGSQALAGGSAWTCLGAASTANTFVGISLNPSTSSTNVIEDNVVTNMVWRCTGTSAVLPGIWTGIHAASNGGFTIDGNTIGAETGTAAVTISTGTTGASSYGIGHNTSSGSITITNNKVGGIIANGTTTALSHNFTGIIYGQAGSSSSRVISGNLVGSLTTANSISVGSSSSTTAQSLIGIDMSTGANDVEISNNTVANLTNTYTSTGASLTIGIRSPFAKNTMTGNTVFGLTSNASTTGVGVSAGVSGIAINASSANGHVVSNNTVHSLSNTHASNAVQVNGVYFNPASNTSNSNTVSNNLVHSIWVTSSSATASVYGIQIAGGTSTINNVNNNMIRLGIKADGNPHSTGNLIYGLYELNGTNNVLHNSIYIGGAGTLNANSFAYFTNPTNTTRNVQNNIFVNARSSTSGTGKHYAIRVGGFTNLTSNYNDLYVTGTNGLIGLNGTTDYTTLGDWQGTGEGANSISGDPAFIDPTGDAGDVDLHIQPAPATTPIEGIGNGSASTSTDIDGDDRTASTPTDMGADCGDFGGVDLTAPAITFTDISGVCNSVTTHTLSGVNVTDASGVNVTAGTAPRIYYKKSTDANDLTGWKYVESSTGSSPFSFDIDFSLLNAGSVTPGDVIQYFVVAQDLAASPNVGITSGTFNSQPSSVALGSGAFGITGTIKEFAILPCSGTVTVGTTGANYPSLTNPGGLFEAINASTLSGNLVAEIITDLTNETGTHPLNQWAESGVGNYTVTIQADGTTQRQIVSTSAATTGLIRIVGADRATFNGGIGSNRYLLFRNIITNNTGASTFSFTGDATNNTINNCVIEGAPTSATNATIFFGTGVSTGNDNNTIVNNDISGNTITTVNAIFSQGTSAAIDNSGNTVSNNNISDFFSASAASAGVKLLTGNSNWSIEDNRFYQTATRTTTTASLVHSAININNTGGGGFVIDGNYIGGDNASGTGTMAYASSTSAQFGAIYLWAGSTGASQVTDNTITNITFSSNSAGTSNHGLFSGIYLNGTGAYTVTGNTVGAATGTGAIAVTLATNSGGIFNGIKNDGTGTVNISGNTIGSLSGIGTGTNVGVTVYGIHFTAGNVTVDGNFIGSSSTASSLQSTGTTTSNSNTVAGIVGSATSSYAPTITDNQIYNLTNNNTGTSTYAGGILTTSSGQYTIDGNLVRNISSNGTASGTGASSSVLGISLNGSNTQPLSISGNTIHSLSNTGAGTASVTGIFFAAGSNTGNTVSRNLVHSLSPSTSTSTTPSVTGIQLGSGVTASNNMVRLGIDETGGNITTAQSIHGIWVSATSTINVYFNTVYIGGSGVGTTSNTHTYAFRRSVTSGTQNVRNNIFVNARSNNTTGSKHYAYGIGATTGLTSDYNLYHAPNTGGVLFLVNTTDYNTLSGLQGASGGQNTSSGVDDPNLVDPTGDATDVDLHITGVTAADEAGIAITGIDVDFDGDDRTSPSTTPTDIGADATDATPKDITPPAVSVSSVPTQAPCGGSLSIDITATVTDAGTGVNTSTFAPTLWWRLSTGSWASLAATSNVGSTWNYTLNLTGVTAGDVYQYYVVAQDQETTPNIGYSHTDGSSPVHANTTAAPSVTNAVPASFTVTSASPLSGTVTVGSGGNYTTLTGTSGLFEAINSLGLNGDLLVEVISNTSETGTHSLYQWAEYCGTGYKVKVVPSDATVKTLSGSLIGFGLINIYASRVTFDGSYGGSGRYLKFENTYASSGGSENNTFKFDRYSSTSLATNDTIRNCEIVGNTSKTAGGVIYLSSGCSNILIDNNIIRGGSNWAANIILALGVTYPNENITITNNEIYNFLLSSGGRAYGINVTNSSNGSNWTIKGNSIFNTGINGVGPQTALRFVPGSSSTGNVIANNWIGGSSAQCGTGGSVTYWGNSYNPSNTEVQIKGIEVNCGTVDIDSNNISNIWVSGSDYTGFIGMHILGSTTADISYNVFGTGSNGQPSNTKMIQVSGGGISLGFYPGYIYGIWNQSTTTSMTTYDHNDFYYLFQSGAYTGGNVHCIAHQTAGPATITSNRINGPQGSGRGWNQYGVRVEPTASTSGNLIEGNIVAGPYINSLVNGGGTTNYGISVKALSTHTHTGTIARNVVWDMRNADRSGYTQGIIVWTQSGGNGTWDIKNNQVTLMNNNSTSNCVGLYGIEVDLNSASTANVEYNTVFIGGSNGGSAVAGVDFSSYSFFRLPNYSGSVTGEALTLRNNIFINWRLVSNGYVTGHFAIGNGGSATNFNTSDYNFLAVANGGASYLGYWGGATRATLANWQSASGKDANSKTATFTSGSSNYSSGLLNPTGLFTDVLADLHISIADGQSYQFVDASATPISIATDYDGDARDGTTPDIGADEFSACATPVVTVNPNSPTICSGANTSVSVTATGSGLSYVWEVNTGSSWTTVSNGGVYSNATTSTLDITGAPVTMNGYQYRAVVTNSCGNSTSSAGTLTVNEAGTVSVSGDGTFCGSAVLTASGGSGGTIYWQNTTSGGTSTATASGSQTVFSSGTYYFRARTSGGCWGTEGSATVTILTAPNATTVWTGDVDADWFKWQNWTNCVPGSITDVTIPAGRPNYPAVYGANPTANSVTIESGATMTLNGGRTLVNTDYINNQGTLTMSAASTIQLGGNWTNTGTFNSGNGTVEFTGTATSSVAAGGTGSTKAFNNILVTKTSGAKVTLSSDIKTNGQLQVTTGEFEVPAGVQALPTSVINNTNGVIRVKSSGQLKVEP